VLGVVLFHATVSRHVLGILFHVVQFWMSHYTGGLYRMPDMVPQGNFRASYLPGAAIPTRQKKLTCAVPLGDGIVTRQWLFFASEGRSMQTTLSPVHLDFGKLDSQELEERIRDRASQPRMARKMS